MKELHSLTGQEFEVLVCDIFNKLGFRTQITKTSGDGGVDIFAQYEGIIFKGTYLIQCKRWSNTVGEPQLRDLYGTTIAENALKGILVTTSSFSRQAIEFAKGKNLELIDGDMLHLLIDQISMSHGPIGPIQTAAQIGFQNHPLFDKEHYVLLDQKIKSDPKNEGLHKLLFKLLGETILKMGNDAITNGLVDEYISRSASFQGSFYRGKKDTDKMARYQLEYDRAFLHFIKGELVAAYELLMSDNHAVYTFNPRVSILKYVIAHLLDFPSVRQKHTNLISRYIDVVDGEEMTKALNITLLHNQNNNEDDFRSIHIICFSGKFLTSIMSIKDLQDHFSCQFDLNIEEQQRVFRIYEYV